MTRKVLSTVWTSQKASGFVHTVDKIAPDRVIHVDDMAPVLSVCPHRGQATVATSRRFIQQA